ncbi:MAG: hypothetical protein IKJ17_03625 [Clostridia bacterium]|nr:hypothetical protein [Clostridia bacterium]
MFFENSHRQSQYSEYSKKIRELQNNLLESLSEEQKKLYHSISLLKLQQSEIMMEEYYEEGIDTATRLTMKIFEKDNETF